MAFSGGKDSTYTMGLLKQTYGLRILALSFDNGFVSERARENIRLVTDALDIDHTFFKPRWQLLKKIFTTSAEKELYSKKSLKGPTIARHA
jgi:tRNA(Ile)-lysidine synthase TilS/MesJ